MRKKKIVKRKRVWVKVNAINILIVAASVFTGFGIVSFCDGMQKQLAQVSGDNVLRSANRIADAFDLYNAKRFPQ